MIITHFAGVNCPHQKVVISEKAVSCKTKLPMLQFRNQKCQILWQQYLLILTRINCFSFDKKHVSLSSSRESRRVDNSGISKHFDKYKFQTECGNR